MKSSHRSCSQHSNSAYNFVCSNTEVGIGPHRRVSFMWRFAYVLYAAQKLAADVLVNCFFFFQNSMSFPTCCASHRQNDWVHFLQNPYRNDREQMARMRNYRPFNWKTVNQHILKLSEWEEYWVTTVKRGSAYSIRIERSYWSMRSVIVSWQ